MRQYLRSGGKPDDSLEMLTEGYVGKEFAVAPGGALNANHAKADSLGTWGPVDTRLWFLHPAAGYAHMAMLMCNWMDLVGPDDEPQQPQHQQGSGGGGGEGSKAGGKGAAGPAADAGPIDEYYYFKVRFCSCIRLSFAVLYYP